MYINIYIKLLEPGDKIAGNGGGAGVDIGRAGDIRRQGDRPDDHGGDTWGAPGRRATSGGRL